MGGKIKERRIYRKVKPCSSLRMQRFPLHIHSNNFRIKDIERFPKNWTKDIERQVLESFQSGN